MLWLSMRRGVLHQKRNALYILCVSQPSTAPAFGTQTTRAQRFTGHDDVARLLKRPSLEELTLMRLVTAVALAAALAVAAACGSSPSSPSTGGTLNIALKDSPFSDAKSLLVTFSEVDAHKSDQTDGQWTTLPFAGGASTRTCDLKKLQASQDILGTGPLAAGQYTQIRLIVSSATIYFDNAAAGNACDATIAPPSGANVSVTIPSGEVKLVQQFTVPTTGATTILLDFDGDQSIQQQGNGAYSMKPVIKVAGVS
jgi:hypothetical protein